MYRIVITKEEDVISTEQVWQQVYDSVEMAPDGKTHAYVDKKVERVKETQLLDQRVEEMDLKAVIVAVNGMNAPVPRFRGKPLTELNPEEQEQFLAINGGNDDGPTEPTA